MESIPAVVSVSGGKDSTATLLLAIERLPKNRIFPVFADTGNEHPATYEYIDYLERSVDIPIKRLRTNFTEWWWRRRDYIRDKWPEKGVPPEAVARALAVFEKGPMGNQFLDLCVIKGRFPSRKAQFCTQELKTKPLVEYALGLIDNYGVVESWQGVRAEESAPRATLPEREDRGGGLLIYRPIHKWTVAQVFGQHHKHGIKPNPLYLQGMGRVGCMPCINVNKDELLEISKRFPEHIDRIAEWEKIVGSGSKPFAATFIAVLGDNETAYKRGNIRQQVEWSKTSFGGKQYDIERVFDEPDVCASAYGLCE